MAHTVSKQIYCEEEKKYIECEVLVLDEEEGLPNTDRREILLHCQSCGKPNYTSEIDAEFISDVDNIYPETELIDQYAELDIAD